MDANLLARAGLVSRTIDTIDRDGKPAKLLTAGRMYPTSVDDLWDAVTNAERIPRWFLPITGDLRPGGRYQLEGNAGGEILTCAPPHRLELTWEFGGDTSWVTVEFSDCGKDEAHLQLEHVAHVPDDLWDQYGPGAVGIGWDLGLMGLDLYISREKAEGPDLPAIEMGEGWEVSEDGRAYIGSVSAAWTEAAIESGTDPEAARASAERVMAFYTEGPG